MRCGMKRVVIAGAELEAGQEMQLTGCHSQVGITLFCNPLLLSSRMLFPPAANAIFQHGFHALRETRKDTCEFSMCGEVSCSPCPRSTLQAPQSTTTNCTKNSLQQWLQLAGNWKQFLIHGITRTQRHKLPEGRAARLD